MPISFRRSAIALALSGFSLGAALAEPQTNPPAPQAAPDEDHDHAEAGDHDHDDAERTLEAVIVQATRTGRAVNDEPVRVEVIGREEIEEKAIMRPGNIATLLAETGGVRLQSTSPALGAANIRLQGLYGRYTQLLSDGLPLYGGQAASIGLL